MEAQEKTKRFKPQDYVIGLGIAVAIFTALSGVAAAIFDQKGDSPIHREVFGNIPTAAKVAFYSIIPALIIYGAWNFSLRVKNWTRGQPDNRSTTKKNLLRFIASKTILSSDPHSSNLVSVKSYTYKI